MMWKKKEEDGSRIETAETVKRRRLDKNGNNEHKNKGSIEDRKGRKCENEGDMGWGRREMAADSDKQNEKREDRRSMSDRQHERKESRRKYQNECHRARKGEESATARNIYTEGRQVTTLLK